MWISLTILLQGYTISKNDAKKNPAGFFSGIVENILSTVKMSWLKFSQLIFMCFIISDVLKNGSRSLYKLVRILTL